MSSHSEHTFSDRVALSIAKFATSRPWLTIAATLVVVLTAAYGLRGIGLATNYRVFFSPQNPELVAFEEFQATYTKNDNILFFIKPSADAVFSPRIADVVETVTERAWQIPFAIRVDSVSNFQHSWADGDDLTVEDLIRDGAGLTQADLDEKRRIALEEPLLFANLVARDVSATGVNVTLQYAEKSIREVPEAVAVARQIAAEVEADYPGVEIALTGVSMLNNAFAEAGEADATTLIPIMYGILLLATFVVLRSLSGTFATLTVIMFSALTAVGIAGYYGVLLAPVSMMAPTVIMTLAVADSVHILVSVLSFMREGMDRQAAIRESLRVNFLPVGITSITTAIGFLALNFSDSPPFWHLGNITAIGILAAWLYSVTFLPAFLTLVRIRTRAVTNSRIDRTLDALAGFVTTRWQPVLVVGGLIAVGLIAMVPRIELNDQWVEYFDDRVEFRRDADFALETMPGIYPIEFSVEADGAEGVNDPEYLRNLDRFTIWLRAQPEVEHVYSYTDIIKRLNKNMHGDDAAWYRIPEDRRLAAQYLFLYEISLPFGLDLNDRISVDKSATRVTATLRNITTSETRAFQARAEAWLEANTPQYMWTHPTSASVMFSYISQRNIESMLTGNLLAVALIAIILMVALRSVALGGLSLIPNLLPILMTYGLWSLLVGRIGMAAATVSATSLGIIVDDTVHFLAKYLRGRREHGYDKPGAIRYAFQTVGRALIANSIILAAGFAFLAFSTFKINVEMGLLTAIAIVIALAFDFLLLPALLLIGSGSNRKREVENENQLAIQQVA